MAECSYARCIQERRTIKKHLQKWTKNCIYTLGFERVAEEFMGRRKWRLYQETVLKSWYPSIEKEVEIKDWDPNQDRCTFCGVEPSSIHTDVEKSPLLLRSNSKPINNNNNTIDLLEGEDSDSNSLTSGDEEEALNRLSRMNALDSVSSMAAIAALAGPGGPSGGHNPLMYPPGVFPRWYLSPPPRALLEGMAKPEPPMVMNLPATPSSEMPLDLSAKSSKPPPPLDSPDNLRVPSMLDTKPMFKAKPRISPMGTGRRTYTEDELQAALRDIQSGKLGTRRAAVIYGIPRSTLRNKVYKLALERERDAHLLIGAPLPRPSPPDGAAPSPSIPTNPEREDSSAEEEKDPHEGGRKPPLPMEDLVRLSELEGPQSDALAALLHRVSRLNAEGVNTADMLASENTLLGSYLAQLLKLKENVSPDREKPKKEVKEEEDKDETASQESNTDKRYSSPILPELMRQIMAEERLLIEEQLKRKMSTQNGVDEDQSNVILRIPSFKPNAGGSKSAVEADNPAATSQDNSRTSGLSPSLNGDCDSPPAGKLGSLGMSSLRDAIAKSISQKFQQDGLGQGLTSPVLGAEAMEALAKRGGFPHLNLPHPHSVLKNHYERNQSRSGHSSSSSSNAQGKGTRPKRGKYRNYDRDSLVEAVRAVQRGEMSVHRAGSYYGVPHSTLEYKVKERHLMRPRKREPKGEDKNKISPPSGSSTANNAVAACGADKAAGKQVPLAPKPPVAKPPFPNPAGLPNGLKIPPSMFETGVSPLAAYAGAPFPFWPPSPFHPLPLDITRGSFPPTPEQLFASQMLRAGGDPSQGPLPPLPPSARRIAESLYDGTGSSGSFLDGIIRSSLEMGLSAQKMEKEKEKSGKNTENMSNKALLDQLCRNSRLTPVPKPSGEELNSDEDLNPRHVPFDLSRSSDDDNDDKRSRKSYASFTDRKSMENDLKTEESLKRADERLHSGAAHVKSDENRSYRSSMSDRSDDEMNGDDLQNLDEDIDEDIDNISNHASEDDDARDS